MCKVQIIKLDTLQATKKHTHRGGCDTTYKYNRAITK